MADEPEVATETTTIQEFTCVRCGFKYQKQHDYEPYLCHRCLRYIAKKVYTIMNQVVPSVSRPNNSGEI